MFHKIKWERHESKLGDQRNMITYRKDLINVDNLPPEGVRNTGRAGHTMLSPTRVKTPASALWAGWYMKGRRPQEH